MGVEGGLSVLGTSGIVEPMSQQAILDTIQLEMGQAALRAGSPRRLILAPGNYGLDYLHEKMPALKNIPVVKTSNFIGGYDGYGGGIPLRRGGAGGPHRQAGQTGGRRHEHPLPHSRLPHRAALRPRRPLRCIPGRLRGPDERGYHRRCMEILDEAEMREPVLSSLLDAIQLHLDRRAAGAFRVGAVLFSNQYGPLGQTRTVKELLDEWKNG